MQTELSMDNLKIKPEQIKSLIDNDYNSRRKRLARQSQKYYEGIHDIKGYRLFYYNADGELVEDTTRSNIKISHPFYTELVDQCVQYMLSGNQRIITSDDTVLDNELDRYFSDDFKSELQKTLEDTCNGFGYMYGYMDNDDVGTITKFVNAEAEGVVEVRKQETDGQTEYVIYWYVERIGKGQKKIKRIQVWDSEATYYFMQIDYGKIVPDTTVQLNPRPHILYTKDGDDGIYYEGYGFIPFFRLDANRKQISHLAPVKDLIDDYDLMSCGMSNNLVDFDTPIYAVKGFEGSDLSELQQNLKTKKVIGVGENGDVDVRTVDIPVQARQAKLELDEKNIYRYGMGFNSSQVGDGNVTNIVIKSRYILLDLKCNKLETNLRAFLKKLLKVALKEINERNKTAYKYKDCKINLEREVMTNALDNAQIELTKAQAQQTKITTILNVASQIDSDTILKLLCDLLDVDYEEVKDKLPDETIDINKASEMLANQPIEGEEENE